MDHNNLTSIEREIALLLKFRIPEVTGHFMKVEAYNGTDQTVMCRIELFPAIRTYDTAWSDMKLFLRKGITMKPSGISGDSCGTEQLNNLVN